MRRFGEILAELRQEKNLPQKTLGELLYVSTPMISNYENSAHYPDAEKLVKLADYFDVSVDYLLGRSTSRLPLNTLEKKFTDDETVGSVLENMQKLSPERKKALNTIIDDMALASIVNQSGGNRDK